jgi:hypothetical protein
MTHCKLYYEESTNIRRHHINFFHLYELRTGIDQLVHSSGDRKDNNSHYEDFSSVKTGNNVVVIIIICVPLQYGQIDRVAVFNGHFRVTCQIERGTCSIPLEHLHTNVTQLTSNAIFLIRLHSS